MCESISGVSARRLGGRLVALAWLVWLSGCGGSTDRVDITGRVTRADGSPLVGAKVSFASNQTGKSALGFTDRDGRYELGTARLGEGIPPGEYYVTVSEDRGDVENPQPPTVHERYRIPGDSGLTFKVEPRGERTFDVVLDLP